MPKRKDYDDNDNDDNDYNSDSDSDYEPSSSSEEPQISISMGETITFDDNDIEILGYRLILHSTQTNMVDVITRTPVTLTQDGNRIVGRAGDQIEFELAFDPQTGNLSITPFHVVEAVGENINNLSIEMDLMNTDGTLQTHTQNTTIEIAQTEPKVRKLSP